MTVRSEGPDPRQTSQLPSTSSPGPALRHTPMDTTRHILTLSATSIETGHPLTVRRLATDLHCSIGTAHTLVVGLTNRGLLARTGPHRTLTPTEAGLILIDRI